MHHPWVMVGSDNTLRALGQPLSLELAL